MSTAIFSDVSETGVTREVSRIANSVQDAQGAIEQIAGLALRLRGVSRLEIEWGVAGVPAVSWGREDATETGEPDVAPLDVKGRHFGRLRLWTDPRAAGLARPGGFAGYLGEQIASIVYRDQIEQRRMKLEEAVELLADDLATRKVFERARGILASRHRIPEADAATMLRGYARRSQRTVRNVCEALVTANSPSLTSGGRYLERRTA